MIVAGYTVPPEVEARLVERMRAGRFTAYDLVCLFQVPGYRYRVVSEIIHRERVAGNVSVIENDPAGWSWRHPAASPAGREG